MAQLQIPTSIWLSATPDERDRFYLDAGFDPNLPVIDNGTDGSFVRFRQDPPFDASQEGGGDYQPGDDMRDPPTVVVPTAIPVPVPPLTALDVGVIPVVGALSVAGRSLRLIMTGGGGRLLAATWNSLPPVSRAALAQVGIGIGTIVAFRGDIPFIDVSREVNNGIVPFDAGSEGGASIPGIVDIQIGANPLQPVQVVGTWVANGVTFYRLADGKLAVQNKKGRWKVWRPKRPIVLYADGAANLKTMLRADKALNKQAKKIAAMLNRRAPKRRTSKKDDNPTIIVQGSGRVIDN